MVKQKSVIFSKMIGLVYFLFSGLLTEAAEHCRHRLHSSSALNFIIHRKIDRDCLVTFQFENPATNWLSRPEQLTPKQLEFAIKTAEMLNHPKTFVEVNGFLEATFASGRGAIKGWTLATILRHFALRSPGPQKAWFVTLSATSWAGWEWADHEFFQHKDAMEKVLRKFGIYEEEILPLFLDVRKKIPANLDDVRDGSCADYVWPDQRASRDYINFLRIPISAALFEIENK